MKRAKNHHNGNGHTSAQTLVAKAASTKKLARAARKHLKMLKVEIKQARKAFRQAKKAAKTARREVRAAMKHLKTKNGAATRKVQPVQRRKAAAPKPSARKASQPAHPLLAVAARPGETAVG
ncbi:MAG: hypothetical protein QOJ40_2409 [Verrucomicrobiota bacterium]